MFRKQKPTNQPKTKPQTKTSSIFLPESVRVHVYFSKYLGRRPLKSKDNAETKLSD